MSSEPDRRPGWSLTLPPSATHALLSRFNEMISLNGLDPDDIEAMSKVALDMPAETLPQRLNQFAAWVSALHSLRCWSLPASLKDTP